MTQHCTVANWWYNHLCYTWNTVCFVLRDDSNTSCQNRLTSTAAIAMRLIYASQYVFTTKLMIGCYGKTLQILAGYIYLFNYFSIYSAFFCIFNKLVSRILVWTFIWTTPKMFVQIWSSVPTVFIPSHMGLVIAFFTASKCSRCNAESYMCLSSTADEIIWYKKRVSSIQNALNSFHTIF